MKPLQALEESWLDTYIYGFRYKVSNFGRVWDKIKNREVKPYNRTAKKGKTYLYVYLYKSVTEHKSVGVHRLVAIAFIPNKQNKPQINHVDGNPTNNYISNLEWATAAENAYHSIFVLKNSNQYKKYADKRKVKVCKVDINTKKIIEYFDSITDASTSCNLLICNIRECLNHVNNTAGGFYWRIGKADTDFTINRNPTSDEVCEVLKEDTGYETVYNSVDLSFTIHCPMYYDYIMLESDGKVWISYDKLSLKSLSIISRFYEAQK